MKEKLVSLPSYEQSATYDDDMISSFVVSVFSSSGEYGDSYNETFSFASSSNNKYSTCSKRSKLSHQSNPFCQVEGCNVDLNSAKDYHRRHRICEAHSKSPKVTVDGMVRRFCQQCSRFHGLSEFDDKKRSCRKRLSDHNARRRRLKPETLRLGSSSMAISSALYDQSSQRVISLSNVGAETCFLSSQIPLHVGSGERLCSFRSSTTRILDQSPADHVSAQSLLSYSSTSNSWRSLNDAVSHPMEGLVDLKINNISVMNNTTSSSSETQQCHWSRFKSSNVNMM